MHSSFEWRECYHLFSVHRCALELARHRHAPNGSTLRVLIHAQQHQLPGVCAGVGTELGELLLGESEIIEVLLFLYNRNR